MSKGFTGTRIPLHMQNPDIVKGKKNPSYESFRPNNIHPVNYDKIDSGHVSTHAMSHMRRYPDGTLDMMWAMNTILDAIKTAEQGYPLTPLEESFLTVVFPLKFRKVEPQQAEIRTQLSRTEKRALKELVEAQIIEELNYNAGRGGGSAAGRSRTINGK